MYFGFLLNTNQVLCSTKLLQFFQVFFFFCSNFFIFFVEITKKRVYHLQISPSPHGLKLTVKQEEIASHEEISRYFNTEKAYAQSKKPKKRYIPDMSHPWKKDNFMKYVYAMGEHETDWVC